MVRATAARLCAALVCATLALRASARAWSAYDLPSPQADKRDVCGRGKKSAVCDPDGVLSRDEGDVVDGLVNFIAEGSHGYVTRDCGGAPRGYQVAVAVLHRMEKEGWKGAAARVKDFAKTLHDSWGVGDAECNNGVVLVVVLDERVMYISTGRGAKGILTDARVQAVLDDMKDLLRQGRVGAALQRGVMDIGQVLAGGGTVGDAESARAAGVVAPSLFALVFGVICCGACGVFPPTPRERYRRCQRALRQLDADRAAARRRVFAATSCPICLEDFGDAKALRRERRARERRAAVAAANAGAAGDAGDAGEGGKPLLPTDAPESEGVTVADLPPGETALPCGHRFHQRCLDSLVAAQHDQCPVCRAPIAGGGVARREDCDWDGFYPEYQYRLHRAHDLYPMYVTSDMMGRWGDRDHNERLHNDAEFAALEPPLIEEARSSGQGGSSFSFGGGSSFGGGGGGSSW